MRTAMLVLAASLTAAAPDGAPAAPADATWLVAQRTEREVRDVILRTPDGIYVPAPDGFRRLEGADPASFECFADHEARGPCRDKSRVWGLRFEPLPELDAPSLRAIVGGCAGRIVGYRDDGGFYETDGKRADRPIDGYGCVTRHELPRR